MVARGYEATIVVVTTARETSRGLPMIAIPSLDAAEVPGTVTAQLQQAARWFFGPARFTRYLDDPATRPSWQATMMAASAFGSAAEWISCVIIPALICVLTAVGNPAVQITAASYAAISVVQIMLTEAWLGTAGHPGDRLARIAALPLAFAALEGPCCAGKTTLARLLIPELPRLAVTVVPCYADHAGGGGSCRVRRLPR